jgi:hypothetical protein
MTRQVITTKGWQDPTKAQLAYLRHLAEATGSRMPKVTTIGGASRAIDRLQEKLNNG